MDHTRNRHAHGYLKNFIVRDAQHRYLCVIQAADIETAMARIPAALRALGVQHPGPLAVLRHEGTSIHWPWFADAFFLTADPLH